MQQVLRPIRWMAIFALIAGMATAATAATWQSPAPVTFDGLQIAQAAQPKAQPAVAPRMNVNVFVAQQELKVRGYDPGPVDGVMGPKTQSALKAFQTKQKIPATGALDARTIRELGIRI